MSLRFRLVLFITLAVSLSMALVFWLSWERVGVQMIAQHTKDILAIMDSEEELVEVDAGHSFDEMMGSIARVRKLMAHMARASLELDERIQRAIRNVTAESTDETVAPRVNNRLVRNFPILADAAGLDEDGTVRIELRRTGIASLLDGGLSHLGLQADTRNLDGSTLAQILHDLPPEGDFFQTELSAESRFGHSLVFLLPVQEKGDVREPARELAKRPKEVVVVAFSLSRLQEDKQAARNDLLQRAYQRFLDQKRLDARVSILDSTGNILASTSHDPMPVPDNLFSCMAENRHEDYLSVIVDDDGGQELALFKNIRSLGWIVQMQVPVSTVMAPVRSAFLRLGLLTALALLVVLAASLWSLGRTLRPLASLIDKTRQLARLDLSSGDALSELDQSVSAGLDVNRRDELGMLARAYVGMGKALGENIRELMRETAWRERMAGEISSASNIQRAMLPGREAMARETNGRVAAFLEPARLVGGDLFDVFTLADGRRALVVGDVSDKGVPAALFMTMVVTLVHQACRFGTTAVRLNPAEVIAQINNLLEERNSDNMFVTLFLGFHDDETGEFVYANGGHCAPLVVSADGRTRFLRETSGPVVGIMPDLDYRPVTTRLDLGDTLVLYTDGVTEARNPEGEFFGEARLERVSRGLSKLSPEEGLQIILEAVQGFQGEAEQADDLTILVYEHRHGLDASGSEASGSERSNGAGEAGETA